MLILSPEERAELWSRAATVSDREERETLVEQIAVTALEESLQSKLDLYGELGDRFVESIQLLAEVDRLFDTDMLRRFQAVAIDERGGERFFASVVGRLSHVAEDRRLDDRVRARAHAHLAFWRDSVPTLTEELWSVEEVAKRYFASASAVYRWIKSGKLDALRTPGGSIIGVPASALAGAGAEGELTRLAVAEATQPPALQLVARPAYLEVIEDINAGRCQKIPPRRYDPVRARVLEEAETLAAAAPHPQTYASEYPDGFVRRGSFKPQS